MGSGIDKDEFEQWAENRPMGEVLEEFKNQLLLILIERLGGDVFVETVEADETPRGKIMTMEVVRGDKSGFHFKIMRKQ